ncbi:hypothetical protein DFP72DRAFT_855556 [Ephemerocybe angulata]|uniref:Uncharacterized protein n=1 Tax=Ephemerocybe angulata TaxID=980116 RepID=A0A8H6HIE5_9AGAR|nr:hypothetical protein DFP72DRAFT_855556 [Tulosesus angulatus]
MALSHPHLLEQSISLPDEDHADTVDPRTGLPSYRRDVDNGTRAVGGFRIVRGDIEQDNNLQDLSNSSHAVLSPRYASYAERMRGGDAGLFETNVGECDAHSSEDELDASDFSPASTYCSLLVEEWILHTQSEFDNSEDEEIVFDAGISHLDFVLVEGSAEVNQLYPEDVGEPSSDDLSSTGSDHEYAVDSVCSSPQSRPSRPGPNLFGTGGTRPAPSFCHFADEVSTSHPEGARGLAYLERVTSRAATVMTRAVQPVRTVGSVYERCDMHTGGSPFSGVSYL